LANVLEEIKMAQFTVNIPNEFMATLDELVTQTNSGTRDQWVRTLIANTLIMYQVQKDLAQQAQQRQTQLASLWT
jgi:metal-responsive CopG/Arc/MetJ family transcriptional regulator